MKVSNTATRLRELLTEKNYRPIDLVNKCQPLCKKYDVKIGRNDISQYLSGKVEPGQKKLSIIAQVLDVDEVYLMGYDVKRDSFSKSNETRDAALFNEIQKLTTTSVSNELLYKSANLTESNQKKVLKEVNDLLSKQNNYFEKDEFGEYYDPYELEYKFKDVDHFNNVTNYMDNYEMLFDKSKNILSDNDKIAIEFIMKKTIDNYEKNKNNQ